MTDTAYEEKLVLRVRDVARIYGTTEKSIRAAVSRDAAWLPRPFRMGRIIAWYKKDIENHIKVMSKENKL